MFSSFRMFCRWSLIFSEQPGGRPPVLCDPPSPSRGPSPAPCSASPSPHQQQLDHGGEDVGQETELGEAAGHREYCLEFGEFILWLFYKFSSVYLISISLFIYIYLSIVSIHLSIYLSISFYLSSCLSIIYQSIWLFSFLPFCVCLYLHYLSVYVINLLILIFLLISICLSLYLSFCLSIYLSIYMSNVSIMFLSHGLSSDVCICSIYLYKCNYVFTYIIMFVSLSRVIGSF